MRKWQIVAGVVAGVLVVSAMAGVLVFKHRYPRDEAGYMRYLAYYGGDRGRGILQLPDQSELTAAGDSACHWLAGQPIAGLLTGPEYRITAVMNNYVRDMRGSASPWTGPPKRRIVAIAAWDYLCPGVWIIHKPHFGSPYSTSGD